MVQILSVSRFFLEEAVKLNVTVAYIDPSIVTYLIQAVAGVVIAVGAVAGIYWRKAKKKVQDKLGIDESAKKEVEEDIVEYSEDGKR